MAEYIEVGQLWNCETCFHRQNGKCSPAVWCDHGESYRPAYDKLKKADVVEVVHGRWEIEIDHDEFWGDLDYYKCSLCGNMELRDKQTPYCPNCGARMDGDKEA